MRTSKELSRWNFGLKTRDPLKAMQFALSERVSSGANSFATKANAAVAQKAFADYLKENKIRDLRKVDKGTVQAFADRLRSRVEKGEISWRTATEYVSRVNATLEAVRYDTDVRVTASEAGFPARDGIAKENHSIEVPSEGLSAQTKAILGIERAFGLRCKEAVLLNAKGVMQHATVGSSFVLERGTKGGRPREVEIRTFAQLEALRAASEVQQGKYSQIPSDKSYAEFRAALYSEVGKAGVKQHGLRHAYAQERYAEVSGVKAPVVAGVEHKAHRAYIAKELGVSLAEARAIDIAARETVSKELGHGRLEITNAYLG